MFRKKALNVLLCVLMSFLLLVNSSYALTIQGTVYGPEDSDQSGVPQQGVRVTASTKDGSEGQYTDSNGGYSIDMDSVNPGDTVEITAEPTDSSYPFTQSLPKKITLSDGDNHVDINLTHPTVMGSVYSPDGVTLLDDNNFHVDVQKHNGSYYEYMGALSPDAGNNGYSFKIGGLTPGDYRFKIYYYGRHEDYMDSFYRYLAIADPAETHDGFNISLTTPTIKGTVYKPDGEIFLPDTDKTCYVTLKPVNGGEKTRVRIHSDGKYQVGGLEDGRYILTTDLNDEYGSVYVNAALQEIEIENGTTKVLELNIQDFTPVGILTDPSNNPIVNAGISIFDQNKNYIEHITNTNAQGEFGLGQLNDGIYYIKADFWDHNLGCTNEYRIVVSEAEITEVNYMPLNNELIHLICNPIQFVLEAKMPDGTFVDTNDYDYRISGNANSSRNDVEYKICAIPDGTYQLYLKPEGTLSTQVDVSDTYTLNVSGGTVTSINGQPYDGQKFYIKFRVLPEPQFTGTVLSVTGNVLNSGRVRVYDTTNNEIKEVDILYNGTFTIGGLADGDYKIRAEVFSGDHAASEYIPITILGDQLTTFNNAVYGSGVPINLSVMTMQIQFKVFSPEPDSVLLTHDVHLRFRSGSLYGYSNGDGIEKIYNIADGEYELYATSDSSGYCPSVYIPVKIDNGNIFVNGEPYSKQNYIHLYLTNPIGSGRVIAVDNQEPVASARVEIFDGNMEYLQSFLADEQGDFGLPWLSDGTYFIGAQKWSTMGNSERIQIVIQDGNITLFNGQPYIGQEIILQLRSIQFYFEAQMPDGTFVDTDDYYFNLSTESSSSRNDEIYRLCGIADGTHQLYLLPEGELSYQVGLSDTYTIVVSGGMVTSINGEPYDGDTFSIKFKELPEPQITGTVMSEDGTVLNLGNISIFNSSGHWMRSIQVSNDGAFAIGGLADGAYEIRAEVNNSVYNGSEGIPVVISEGRLTVFNGQAFSSDSVVLTVDKVQFKVRIYSPEPEKVLMKQDVWPEVIGTGTSSSSSGDGIHYVSSISDGDYELEAVYRGNEYCPSLPVSLSIHNGNIVIDGEPYDGGIVDLYLENPIAAGYLAKPDGTQANSRGWINVYKSSGEYVKNFQANTNGHFAIGSLEDGTYLIEGRTDEGDYFTSEDIRIFISNNTLVSVNGNTYEGAPVIIRMRNPQMKIKAFTPENAQDMRPRLMLFGSASTTSNNGKLLVSDIPAGTYYFMVMSGGGLPYAPSDSHTITVKPDGSIFIDNLPYADMAEEDGFLHLQYLPPVITGTLKNPYNDNPIPEAEVVLQTAEGENLYRVFSDSTGKFYFGQLSDAEYRIFAAPRNVQENPDLTQSKTHSLTIKDGQPTIPLNIYLGKVQFQGIVKTPEGKPAQDVRVEVTYQSSGGSLVSVWTNNNGQFRIGGLEDGFYSVKTTNYQNYVRAEDVFIRVKDGIVTRVKDQTYNNEVYEITLGHPQLSGKALCPDNSAASYAWVEVYQQDGRHLFGVNADQAGIFYLGGLPDGIYTVILWPTDLHNQYTESADTELVISNGQYSGGELILRLTHPYITGQVKNPDGSSAANGSAHIADETGNWIKSTDIRNGVFKFSNLRDGQYTVFAFPSNNSIYAGTEGFSITIANGICQQQDIVLYFTTPQFIASVQSEDTSMLTKGTVEIFNSSMMQIGRGEVRNDGTLAVGGLEDGEYYIWVYLSDRVHGRTERIPFTISGERLTTFNGEAYTSGSIVMTVKKIQLKVRIYSPKPDSVLVLNNTGPRVSNTAVCTHCKGDGIHYVSNIADGDFELVTVYRGNEYCPSLPVTLSIHEGIIIVDGKPYDGGYIDLYLTEPIATGYLAKPDGTEATQEGSISVINNNGDRVKSFETDLQGQFAIGGLEDGTYYLEGDIWNSDYARSDRMQIIVVNNSLTSVDGNTFTGTPLVLKVKMPQIKIKACTPDGKQDLSAKISINANCGCSSNNRGFFIWNMQQGTYDLYVMPGNGLPYAPSEKLTVTVTSDGSILINNKPYNSMADANGYITMRYTQPTILDGKVTSPYDGKPVSKAEVFLMTLTGDYLYRVNTDSNGNFYLGELPIGDYSLFAVPPQNMPNSDGLTESKKYLLSIKDGEMNGNLNIVLGRKQFTGHVKTPQGAEVGKLYIEVLDALEQRYIVSVRTDNNGNFVIGGLEDGTYIIRTDSYQSFAKADDIKFVVQGGLVSTVQGTPYNNLPYTITLNETQISGTILCPDHAPAAYSWVEVRSADGQYLFGVSATEAGTFSLSGLPDGTYLLNAIPSGMLTDYTQSGSVEIIIANGKYTGQALVLNLTQPVIKGAVKNPDGSASAGGWVEVRDSTGKFITGSGINQGLFKISHLPDGTYLLTAFPDSGASWTQSEESEATIKDGICSQQGIVLSFTKAQITGSVVNKDDARISGGWIDIRCTTDPNLSVGIPVKDDGSYQIGGLLNGSYEITAIAPWGSAYLDAEPVQITIPRSSSDELKLQLKSPQLRGQVFTPEGASVRNGWIEVLSKDGKFAMGYGMDNNGFFYAGGLPDGDYNIYAYPEMNSPYCKSAAVEISIVSGNFEGGRLIINLTQAQINGSVKNPDGSEAAEGWVQIRSIDNQWYSSVSIDGTGKFKISGLEDGEYMLCAYPDIRKNYVQSDEVSVRIENGVYQNQSVLLEFKQVQITGQFKTPDGQNTSFAYAEVTDAIGNWITGAGADSNGRFNIGRLTDGEYWIRARADERSPYFDSDRQKIEISAGKASTQTINLALTNPQVKGTVKASSGEAVESGYVVVLDKDRQYIAAVPVDNFGKFRLGGLSAGIYYLTAYSSDRDQAPSAEITFEISNGLSEAEIINVTLPTIQITGTVLRKNEQAAPFGWIEITDPEGNYITGTGVDQEGRFAVSGLSDGQYFLKAYPGSSANDFWSDNISITVSNGLCQQNNIKVYLRSAQIMGTVSGPNGEKLSSGWVEITDQNNIHIMGSGVNSDGTFIIAGLKDGVYQIRAYPDRNMNFVPSVATSITIANGTAQVSQLQLVLKEAAINGVVKGPGNEIIQRGYVEVYDANNQWVISAGLDNSGMFRIGSLSDGTYTLRAFAADNLFANSNAVTLAVRGGKAESGLVTLNLTRPVLEGSVKTPSAQLYAECWVEIGDASQQWLYTIPVTKDGTFKVPALAEGSYTIQAFDRLGSYKASEVVSFTINKDGTMNGSSITLQLKQ